MNEPVPQDLPITLQLPLNAVNIIINALGEYGPYRVVSPVMHNVHTQTDTQVGHFIVAQQKARQEQIPSTGADSGDADKPSDSRKESA